MSVGVPLFNRELSWLAFNRRVLEMALDERLPPLERLRFLAITASNLDEFFMVRVGGLQTLEEQGDGQTDMSGMRPSEQLATIRETVSGFVADQYRCLLDDLEPKLAAAGLRRLCMAELTPEQAAFIERVFEYEIFPLLTPVAVDLDEPFPMLSGLSLHLCVRLKTMRGGASPKWAVVSVPRGIGRVITVPSPEGYHYILAEDVIGAYLDRLFPGEPLIEHAVFRLTRNADLAVREDAADDLLAQMKEILTERRQSSCVRLEIREPASEVLKDFLRASLSLEPDRVYTIRGPLALSAMMGVAGLAGLDALRLEPWPPQPNPVASSNESIFDTIAHQDILLFHPYEQFDPVQRLVEEAADDPNVLAIKQILYRTSENSPIVAALMRAAERNKNVTVVVELKARFDEARNIEWATALEQAGAQVLYGVKGLKTHAKVCLVVRREPRGIQRYVHFGTGNYNERTARLYSDVSLLTCDEDLCADASAFFNTLTGSSRPLRYRKLEAAPHGLRERLLELIENEIARSRHGQDARIMAKLNSLVDPDIIKALYKASQNGVRVDLNVRGICCLVPGVAGLSERIRVVSIVDRFLEHSRILYFHNGGDPLVFISSADWMPRNLDRRVELLVPVESAACRNRLIEILETCLADNQQAWELQADGTYLRLHPLPGQTAVRSQRVFYEQAVETSRAAREGARMELEPLRPAPRKSP